MEVHPEMENLTQYYAFLPQTYAKMMKQPQFKSQIRQFQQKAKKPKQQQRRMTIAAAKPATNNSSFSIRMNRPPNPRTSI